MFSRFVEFPWVSPHLDLWHSVCNKPASLLFVQKMFCNVSYFHFSPHKENFMWGSYFTFIFLFPRASFALPDKTHNYILLNIVRKRRKTIFSKRLLALYFWFPGSSMFSLLNVRQNLPSLLFGDLEKIFSFSVCLFEFVLDEESKLLKPTQSCFLLELIREGQDKGCLFRFSDVHSQRLLLNFHFHDIKDYFHFHNIKDYFNFHKPSFTLSKSWLQLFVWAQKRKSGSRLPLKHFHTSAAGIHISNAIYSGVGENEKETICLPNGLHDRE